MIRILSDILQICSRVHTRSTYPGWLDVPLCFPPARMHFCELNARLIRASSDWGSTVPRKIALNCVARQQASTRSIANAMAHLVHASIGEKEGRVLIRDGGRGWDIGMFFALEEVEELLAHLRGCQVGGWRGGHPCEGARGEESMTMKRWTQSAEEYPTRPHLLW